MMPESDRTSHHKAEDKEKPKQPKKPPGYRKFQKLLKQVVKAPPLCRELPSTKIEKSP